MKPEDMDKIIELFQKMGELRGTKGYPKGITPTYTFQGTTSGFTLYNVEEQSEISNFYFHCARAPRDGMETNRRVN